MSKYDLLRILNRNLVANTNQPLAASSAPPVGAEPASPREARAGRGHTPRRAPPPPTPTGTPRALRPRRRG